MNSARALPDQMQATLDLPNGARFRRCALQVNPFAYLGTHNKKTPFKSEDEYNSAIVDACLENEIEVIAVTDHYRVAYSAGLVRAARKAKIHAFSGFEAVAKDGVHFLCLFDPDKEESLERFIGECGILDADQPPPTGKLDSLELLESSKTWGAVCIAAHVASEGGLLRKLSGQSRINVWRDPALIACALPGPVGDAPDGIRQILENKDAQHKRDHPVAILNASDVNDPEDLKKQSASCFIKMSKVSIEAFRQAFLDPGSRVRLHSDERPESHAELLAITWEGGFLSDTAVHFNENLNVLIGGRGTGKSTMIESIRYALDLTPLGEDVKRSHEGVIRHVLRPGTKISLRVRSYKPSERYYTIERTVPNPPVVRDEARKVLDLSPQDVMPGVEIYGQHEISELTKSPEKLTLLLRRFTESDPALSVRKLRVSQGLERSRIRIVDVRRQLRILDEQLAALPGLEETHRRFQQAGIEERLKEKSWLLREERLFASLDERLDYYRAIHNELKEGLPVDTAFVSYKALQTLPNADVLSNLEGILTTLSENLVALYEQLGTIFTQADEAIVNTKLHWSERKKTIEQNYEKLLRELQKSNIDGAEFIQLRQQIEELRPLTDRMQSLNQELDAHEAERRNFLAEWEDIKSTEYRRLDNAAKRVSKKLGERVRVAVAMAGNRDPLEELLRELGGNLSPALERLRRHANLSLAELAQRCREGRESLIAHYNLPPGAAERIAGADLDFFMRIEELELPATTDIELNTAHDGAPASWRRLQALSTGQKATAVLLLLLLESTVPLVIDQPEDDLDNRFITEGVVPIMRQEKRNRQFVFSTHNANIPVLGDAELILGLTSAGEVIEGKARIAREHMASIDSISVRELVEEILEGGKAAFEMRRSKYGF